MKCFGRTLIEGRSSKPAKSRMSPGTWSQHQQMSGWLRALPLPGSGRDRAATLAQFHRGCDGGGMPRGTSLAFPALAQEGGDEDAGVQVERGVPPAVREIQHLWERGAHGCCLGVHTPPPPAPKPRGARTQDGTGWLAPGWTHLARAQGALQRSLGWRQRGVGVVEPGQRGLVGVEVRGLIRWVQEPALQNTGTGDTSPLCHSRPSGGGGSTILPRLGITAEVLMSPSPLPPGWILTFLPKITSE